MKRTATRTLSLLLTLAMLISLFSGMLTASAATKNNATRHTVATELSAQAKAYYTGSYSYETMSQLEGGTENCLTSVSSPLFCQLRDLMTDTMTSSVTYSSLTSYWPTTDSASGASDAILFYSDEESSSYNREHVWPKSRASFYQADGGSDLHHLRPTSSTINSTRSNYTMGNVRSQLSDYSTQSYGNKTVLYYSGSADLVEVNDNIKGDVARILLYVYTRWEEPNLFMNDPNPKEGENDTGGNDGTKVIESLDTLLQWCRLDPVDEWEMTRNDLCQDVQGNRNVFIDYPEYAWLLFGQELPTDMTTPSGEAANSSNPTEPSTEPTEPSTEPTESSTEPTEPGTERWVIADSVQEGDTIALVALYEDTYYAMTADTSVSNSLVAAPVTVTGNTLSLDGADGAWVIGSGNTLTASDGSFITNTSGTTLSLSASGTSFDFTCGDGTSMVLLSSNASRGLIFRMSSGSPIFRAYSSTNATGEYSQVLTIWKQTTGSDPVEPTEPTEPSTEPTEPSTEPTEPSTEPTEPSTEPTEPSTEPTEPSTEPTEPGTESWVIADSVQEGDTIALVALYNDTYYVMTTDTSVSNALGAAVVTVSGDKLSLNGADGAWKVSADGTLMASDGTFITNASGTALKLTAAGTSFVFTCGDGTSSILRADNATRGLIFRMSGEVPQFRAYSTSNSTGEYSQVLTIWKQVSGSDPVEPTEPTEPSTEPTEPSTEPTEPSTEPTEPSAEPTEPSTEPTEPEAGSWVIADSVQEGDTIALVALYNDTYYAMTTDTSVSNALGAAVVTVSGDKLSLNGADGAWKVSADGTLMASDGTFITNASGTALKLTAAGTSFVFTCGDGTSSILRADNATRGLIFRMSGEVPQFRAYSTGNATGEYSQVLTIWKQAGSSDPTEPSEEPTEPSEEPTEPTEESSEAPVEPTEPEESFALTTTLTDGDRVVIVHDNSGMALSDEASGTSYRAGVAVTPENDVLTTNNTHIIWNVTAETDGFVFTNAQGQKLSIGSKGLNLDADHSVWEMIPAATAASCVYLRSTTAVGSQGDPKAIEYYSGSFTTFYLKDTSTEADFALRIYVLCPTHTHSWDEGVVTTQPTCTQDGLMTYTCACGETKTEPITATGHSFTNGVCSVCGAYEHQDEALTFFSAAIGLEDKIIYSALVNSSVLAGYDSYYVEFTNLDACDDRMSNYKLDKGTVYATNYRLFQFPIYVCQMTDRIAATLYGVKGDVVYQGQTVVQTVENFTYSIISKLSESKQIMCANMLEYGAKMQENFQYRLDHLANDELGAYADLVISTVPVAENRSSVTDYGYTAVTLTAQALSIASSIQMQYAFKLDGVTADEIYIAFTANGETLHRFEGEELLVAGNRVYVIFEDLLPTQADMEFQVTAYSKSTGEPLSETHTGALAYSAALYQTSQNETLRSAVNAMLNYYRAAEIAFTQ